MIPAAAQISRTVGGRPSCARSCRKDRTFCCFSFNGFINRPPAAVFSSISQQKRKSKHLFAEKREKNKIFNFIVFFYNLFIVNSHLSVIVYLYSTGREPQPVRLSTLYPLLKQPLNRESPMPQSGIFLFYGKLFFACTFNKSPNFQGTVGCMLTVFFSILYYIADCGGFFFLSYTFGTLCQE